MSVDTFIERLAGIVVIELYKLPRDLDEAISHLPAIVFTALVVPALLYPNGTLFASLHNNRLIAGSLAAIIAIKTQNILFTITAGMILLYFLQAL
jgi:branched-subunit amino acid transport protein